MDVDGLISGSGVGMFLCSRHLLAVKLSATGPEPSELGGGEGLLLVSELQKNFANLKMCSKKYFLKFALIDLIEYFFVKTHILA